jgi:hypothetical protein
MHPDILKALAEARRADLLRPYEFRQPDVLSPKRPNSQRRVSLSRARHVLGAALVGAGTRLLGDGTPGIDVLDSGR